MHVVHRHTETREVTTDTHQTLCDLCERDVEKVAEESENVGEQEVTISAAIGDKHYWEDGDERTRYVLDVCMQCFLVRVKPAIEALGCTFREKDANNYFRADTISATKKETLK